MSDQEITAPDAEEVDQRHPLQIADFRAFWLARLFGVLATSAQGAAVAWQAYDLVKNQTHDISKAAFYMGLIGLGQFITLFCLTVPAGIVADRVDRKQIYRVVSGLSVLLSLAFLAYSYVQHPPFWGFLVLSSLLGAMRAFSAPASAAIGPMLVPKYVLPKAIAINAMAFQTGIIVGPVLGGLLIALSPHFAFMACAVIASLSCLMLFFIKTDTRPEPPTTTRLAMIKEGLVYIWEKKIIFGAISLDLAAVLLGGVTALLPVFARDILHAGPLGFGLLRSSVGVGALSMSFWLSFRPLRRHAGGWMFGGVAVFGICTIIFGLSNLFWLSFISMVILGAADMISVYVRGTLVQIVTPDHMRGRVSSVSYLFIGASNELGEFESGVVARFLGPIGSVLFGGIGSILVTGAWIKLFPDLYKADRLE